MANLYSTETAGLDARPVRKPALPAYGGRLRRYRATIPLASQGVTDNIMLCVSPPNAVFVSGTITTSVSLGTSVVAIGTSQTHANNGQYRAAGTFTAVDTPTLFGRASALSAEVSDDGARVYMTIATSSLPAAGTLVVDLHFATA
jgi:hypothetical protein